MLHGTDHMLSVAAPYEVVEIGYTASFYIIWVPARLLRNTYDLEFRDPLLHVCALSYDIICSYSTP